MTKSEIYKKIQELIKSKNKPNILIGIDGGQGSGKSYFIKELQKKLIEVDCFNVVVIETDDFLVERTKREHLSSSFFENIANLSNLFDFEEFNKGLVLLQTSNNKVIKFNNFYNHETGKRDRIVKYQLLDQNIILVGGPYLLNSSFPKFDLRIFIDVTEEKRLSNTLMRAQSRGRSTKSQKIVFKNFEKFYNPYFLEKLDVYDLIVDNNNFKDMKIKTS